MNTKSERNLFSALLVLGLGLSTPALAKNSGGHSGGGGHGGGGGGSRGSSVGRSAPTQGRGSYSPNSSYTRGSTTHGFSTYSPNTTYTGGSTTGRGPANLPSMPNLNSQSLSHGSGLGSTVPASSLGSTSTSHSFSSPTSNFVSTTTRTTTYSYHNNGWGGWGWGGGYYRGWGYSYYPYYGLGFSPWYFGYYPWSGYYTPGCAIIINAGSSAPTPAVTSNSPTSALVGGDQPGMGNSEYAYSAEQPVKVFQLGDKVITQVSGISRQQDPQTYIVITPDNRSYLVHTTSPNNLTAGAQATVWLTAAPDGSYNLYQVQWQQGGTPGGPTPPPGNPLPPQR